MLILRRAGRGERARSKRKPDHKLLQIANASQSVFDNSELSHDKIPNLSLFLSQIAQPMWQVQSGSIISCQFINDINAKCAAIDRRKRISSNQVSRARLDEARQFVSEQAATTKRASEQSPAAPRQAQHPQTSLASPRRVRGYPLRYASRAICDNATHARADYVCLIHTRA